MSWNFSGIIVIIVLLEYARIVLEIVLVQTYYGLTQSHSKSAPIGCLTVREAVF